MADRAEYRPVPAGDDRPAAVCPAAAAAGTSADVTARLAAVAAGDRAARAWLYDRFAPRLYRRLRGRYGGPGGLDADELLQDTYVSVLQHDARVLSAFIERVPGGERTEARLEAWLWDTACGVASNRRRSRRRNREVPYPEFDPAADTADPERAGLARDTLRRMVDCLRTAGSRIHLYYKLRHVDGLTPVEVTRVTGWSRKATYKLKDSLNEAVRRCARRLRLR